MAMTAANNITFLKISYLLYLGITFTCRIFSL